MFKYELGDLVYYKQDETNKRQAQILDHVLKHKENFLQAKESFLEWYMNFIILKYENEIGIIVERFVVDDKYQYKVFYTKSEQALNLPESALILLND